jgi:hypothetical protein
VRTSNPTTCTGLSEPAIVSSVNVEIYSKLLWEEERQTACKERIAIVRIP